MKKYFIYLFLICLTSCTKPTPKPVELDRERIRQLVLNACEVGFFTGRQGLPKFKSRAELEAASVKACAEFSELTTIGIVMTVLNRDISQLQREMEQ